MCGSWRRDSRAVSPKGLGQSGHGPPTQQGPPAPQRPCWAPGLGLQGGCFLDLCLLAFQRTQLKTLKARRWLTQKSCHKTRRVWPTRTRASGQVGSPPPCGCPPRLPPSPVRLLHSGRSPMFTGSMCLLLSHRAFCCFGLALEPCRAPLRKAPAGTQSKLQPACLGSTRAAPSPPVRLSVPPPLKVPAEQAEGP